MDAGVARLGAIVAAPVQALATGARRVTLATAMLFNRGAAGWQVLYARTLIDYRREVGDPLQNSAVSAVAGWIARNFPDAPVRVLRLAEAKPPDPIMPAPAGPGAMLRLLERPNPYYSGVLQWRATVIDFLRGDAYWLKVRNDADRVVGLWWAPNGTIEPRWPEDDPSVFIGWYEWTVDGATYAVRPRDVVHFRNGISPLNTRKGVDQLGSLYREIFTDNEAAAFTAALLRNLGVPGVVIAPANTVTQIKGDPEDVKRRWMEKTSGDKRGEPIVFTTPTDVKVLSWNPQELDLRAARRVPEERVSAVLGVPAGVAQLGAGLDRNTFSNYGEANRAAYVQGVIPMHRLIAAELEVQLLPEFFASGDVPERYDVDFDASVTQAMAEAADQVWKRAESAAGKGLLTRAAFKRMVGQPATPEDEVYVMPSNYLVIPSRPDRAPLAPPPAPVAPAPPRQLPPGPPPPAQLPPGQQQGASALMLAALGAGPVRCSRGHLLAELASPPYRLQCHRCKDVAEAPPVPLLA